MTIAAVGCTVSEGASITLEDQDGTQARFVDGQLGIEITSTGGQITMVGPDNDYIGDHAVSSSDPGFDTDGDYAVVATTGIACEGAGPPTTEPEDTTPAGKQYAPQAPPGDPSNPRDVIPGTGARQVPDTGGPPYLTTGALVLVVAALIVGRGVLRR